MSSSQTIAVGGSSASSSSPAAARGVVEVEARPAQSEAAGSTPTDSSAARQRALRIWKVGYCVREPSWPIRRWPSSIRCASAASVPPAVSSETHGTPSGSASMTTIRSPPGRRSGGSTEK